MAYRRITWLPDVLRKEGITVVLYDGWETRGLSRLRRFEPQHVVWHHDASAVGDSPGVPGYMIRNFNNAGAQVWVDRYGRWHIIASGRAPHAGKVRAGAPSNETSIGIETDHTVGEAWPPAQLDSLRRGTAAILRHMNRTAKAGLHFHKSICYPPGRKIDPDGLDLNTERARVAALMKEDDVLTPAQMKELKDHVTATVRTETRKAVRLALVKDLVIPAPAGSLAAKHYGKGAKLSVPNALYWVLREAAKR